MASRHSATIRWIVGLGSLGLALFFAVLASLALSEREALWQLQMAKQAELQRQALHGSQRTQRQQAQLLAETIAADAWVIELLRQAHALQGSGYPERAALQAIRNQLYTRLAPRWRNLQAQYPFALTLYLAPAAEVLLRVHSPEQFGDRPDPRQPMVLDALGEDRPKTGLGADGLSLHAVTPARVEGAGKPLVVGALEVSLGMLDNLPHLDQQLDAGIALLTRPDGADQPADWRLAGHSRPQIDAWHAQRRLPDPTGGDSLELLEDQGRTYLLNQVRLPGYPAAGPSAQDTAAIALSWRDVSELFARHRHDQRWLIGKWLLAWFAAESVLLLLLLGTRDASQALIRRHRDDLQRKHRQSEQARQLLAVIAQAQAAYIDAQNQGEAFAALLGRILELSDSRFGFIGEVLEDERGARHLRSYAIGPAAGDAGSADLAAAGTPLEDPESLLGQVLRSGQALIDNAPGERRSGLAPGHPALQAFAGLPIHAHGQLVGMLGLANRPGGYPNQLAEQLQPLLATLAQVIQALRRDSQRDQAQHRLQRQQGALRALSEIAALPTLSSQEQLRQALQLGAEFYCMPLAIISQIDGEEYQVRAQVSPPGSLSDGQRFPLGDTYCSIAVQRDEPLAIERMAQSPHAPHPCYRLFALESYIGIVIRVAGRRFGTLCFASPEAREQPFDDAEREFLALFARWVGATLERQHQEQARQALLQRLDEAQRIARLGHWEANLLSGELYWSNVIFDIFGYAPQGFAPSIEAFKRCVHPDDLALVEASERRVQAGGTHDVVHRILRPDGEVRWVHELARLQADSQGRLVRLVGTVQDISEAKQREAEVQEARAFLQAVLDAATGVAIIATDAEGLISLFNPGAERLLGYRAEEVVGRVTPAIFHLPSEIQAGPLAGFEALVAKARAGGTETRTWTYLRRDGERRAVNLTVSAIHDGSAAISGFLGIASDISELQQATRALQKSESRFRGMVANLPGVVYRCRHDADWSMRYMSEEILALSGYPASDFIDNRLRSYASIIHPDDLPSTYAIEQQLRQQQSFELTYRLRHADGHHVWVRGKGRGEYDRQGTLLWLDGFIWDISERKRIEDELGLSQQRFSSAFNTAPLGMALVSPEGRWLEVNDELCRMLDYPREQLLGSDVQSITHPDDLASSQEKIADLLAGRITAYQLEKRYLNRLGQVIWVQLSVSLVRDGEGRPVHLVAQFQDFSERVAAERALREREHYLRTVLDNVLDAIVTIDEMGRIETFNHAAEQLFGYRQADLAGRNVNLLMPEPYHSAHDGYLARYRQTGEARLIGRTRELTGLRANGELFAMELAISQVSHQGQRRFIALIRDISERKRIDQLKDDFVSTVSHELRTPLTAIAGALGLVNGGALGELPAGIRQMLAIAQDNSQRLGLLINDLLDMDKLVAGKLQFELSSQALMPLIEQALEQNRPYAQQFEVELRLVQRADAAWVRVDGQRLQQVLANLLSNAAKFSPPGGVVSVRVHAQGERVRVSIGDQGAGIPEAFQTRIFSKFSQADATSTRKKGGTGLGLAISKEIIERLDGRIGFDSAEGQGATFWFELPSLEPLMRAARP